MVVKHKRKDDQEQSWLLNVGHALMAVAGIV